MAEGSSQTQDPSQIEPPHEPPGSDGQSEPARPRRSAWRELPFLLLVALVLAVLIKSFLVQAFYIPSASMEPTLQQGDRILVCRVCLHVQDIHRGDVLVFSDPNPTGSGRGLIGGFFHWLREGVGVAQPDNPDFVKRVGALPGDTWEIREGTLYIGGQAVDRPFLSPNVDRRSFGPQTVPSGMLLMLGDNPLDSGDSRFSSNEGGLGYVPIDKVIGKVFVRVWPPSRMGWIH